MIDEKKIEEAAEEYSKPFEGICNFSTINAYREGFKAGVNWVLDNLWHDASEVPEKRKYILVEYGKGHIYKEPTSPYEVQWLYKDFTGEPWKQLVKYEKITRWLYIDDLLKGGK